MPRQLRVFLCHASQDKPAVRKMYTYLKQHGVQPWLDREDLLPGQDWEVEISKAIENSDVILVCLSKNSVNKEGYVQKEIAFALDKRLEKPVGAIFLIPIKLEECDVPRRLSPYQWVDYFHPDGKKRLLLSLNLRSTNLGAEVGPVIVENTRGRIILKEKKLGRGGKNFNHDQAKKSESEIHQTSQLANEPILEIINEKLEQALLDRDLDEQYKFVNMAISVAWIPEDKKRLRERKNQIQKHQETYNNIQILRMNGKLAKALMFLRKTEKYDKRADKEIVELEEYLIGLEEASKAVAEKKYNEAMLLYEQIKKLITLPGEHEKTLRKACFESYQIEAKNSLQLYDLAGAIRNYETALRHSPKQNIKAIKNELYVFHALWGEVQDWEKTVRRILDQGAELEGKRNLDAANGRYRDAFAVRLSKDAERFVEKIYPTLHTELIDSMNRVDKLIYLREKIDKIDSENDDPENQLKIYNQYLELSIFIIPEYMKQAKKLEVTLNERRKYMGEFEIIRMKLESDDIEQLEQAFQRFADMEREIVNAGDTYLTGEFSKLSREMYNSYSKFKEYSGLIDEAQRLISEGQYQPAMSVVQRAENVRNTPETQGLKSEIASSIERKLVIADQFKIIENRMQEEDWKGANDILIQIAAIGPRHPEQRDQLANLRDHVSAEIERSDMLKRHFEIMRGLLNRFDYEEAENQLHIARERCGNRLEFIEIEEEIGQVRQNCVRLDDLLQRANEAYARNRLKESESLYYEARLISNSDEIMRIKNLKFPFRGNRKV